MKCFPWYVYVFEVCLSYFFLFSRSCSDFIVHLQQHDEFILTTNCTFCALYRHQSVRLYLPNRSGKLEVAPGEFLTTRFGIAAFAKNSVLNADLPHSSTIPQKNTQFTILLCLPLRQWHYEESYYGEFLYFVSVFMIISCFSCNFLFLLLFLLPTTSVFSPLLLLFVAPIGIRQCGGICSHVQVSW
jgi:hypothetical protein